MAPMSALTPSAYPVGYQVEFVERRSRLTTFFRMLMAIPVLLVMIVYGIVAYVAVVIAWFALLITGRYPEGLYGLVGGVLRLATRANAYMWLATDTYPPFGLGEHPEHPVQVPIGPPKASYSRLKVLFRIILGIPVILINYALGIVLEIAALLSWFWIVVTGRQHSGLQSALDLGLAYSTRHNAYFALLTEDWPPFSPDGSDPLGPGKAPVGVGPGPETAEHVRTPATRPTDAP